MKLPRLSIALYGCLIFASGVVVGAVGNRLYMVNTVIAKGPPRPEEWRRHYMAEMQSRLKLNSGQTMQLNGILDETQAKFHEVRERSRPELDAIRQRQIEKIRALLDDGQRTEYEKMREERERNAQKNAQKTGPGL